MIGHKTSIKLKVKVFGNFGLFVYIIKRNCAKQRLNF